MIRLYVQYKLVCRIFWSSHLQVSEYIAECARILDKSGLKYQVRTFSSPCLELLYSTNILMPPSDAVRSRIFNRLKTDL